MAIVPSGRTRATVSGRGRLKLAACPGSVRQYGLILKTPLPPSISGLVWPHVTGLVNAEPGSRLSAPSTNFSGTRAGTENARSIFPNTRIGGRAGVSRRTSTLQLLGHPYSLVNVWL